MPANDDRCCWTRERIEAYVDGELGGAELAEFERHVDDCESCRSELSLARAVVEELRSLPELKCPDGVVEKAAERIGVDSASGVRSWTERFRETFGPRFSWVPKPAMAAMLLVIVAATVFVLTQRDHSRFDKTATNVAPTEKELELAEVEVKLAFAYIGRYSQRTSEIIKHDVIADRVVKPLEKAVVEPVYPFQKDE